MARADASAFPQHVINPTPGSYGAASNAGMTMREWYAGQALIGELARDGTGHYEALADACFAIADAMLAESQKK